MKKGLLFCGGLLVAATLLFVSCKKDKEVTPTVNKYFSVENGTLISKNMPDPTSNEEIAVVMNENVICGGSSYVRVSSERVAKKILVGMKDQAGYYEVSPTTRGDYSFVLMVNQDIDLADGVDAFTVQVAIEDENGDISQVWETSVTLLVVGTGALQVSLSFDNLKDVDLHLIEPEYNDEYGEPVAFYDRHIYYGHTLNINGGELDLDSNAGCSLDGVNNENITYGEDAFLVPGTYKVYVDLWENCDSEEEGAPKLPTNYVVTVFYGGNLLASRAGVFEAEAPSTFNPISADYVEQNDPFLSFTIANNGQKRVKTFEPVPMSASAIEKEANSVHK